MVPSFTHGRCVCSVAILTHALLQINEAHQLLEQKNTSHTLAMKGMSISLVLESSQILHVHCIRVVYASKKDG